MLDVMVRGSGCPGDTSSLGKSGCDEILCSFESNFSFFSRGRISRF